MDCVFAIWEELDSEFFVRLADTVVKRLKKVFALTGRITGHKYKDYATFLYGRGPYCIAIS